MPQGLEIGTLVADYRIESYLGRGGQGIVYLAEDLHLKRKVALKFLGASSDTHARARLLREAQTASALDHPNVATVYEVGDWNGEPFIAMTFCEGENGKYDFFFPERRHQETLFAALGTSPDQKRRLVYPTGHNLPRVEMMKETLDWLDRCLGEVK